MTKIEKKGGHIKTGGVQGAENSVDPPKNDVFISLMIQNPDVR